MSRQGGSGGGGLALLAGPAPQGALPLLVHPLHSPPRPHPLIHQHYCTRLASGSWWWALGLPPIWRMTVERSIFSPPAQASPKVNLMMREQRNSDSIAEYGRVQASGEGGARKCLLRCGHQRGHGESQGKLTLPLHAPYCRPFFQQRLGAGVDLAERASDVISELLDGPTDAPASGPTPASSPSRLPPAGAPLLPAPAAVKPSPTPLPAPAEDEQVCLWTSSDLLGAGMRGCRCKRRSRCPSSPHPTPLRGPSCPRRRRSFSEPWKSPWQMPKLPLPSSRQAFVVMFRCGRSNYGQI